MARSADLNRKSSSGISYARAAKKFGTTPEVVKAYAQQVREFNRQQRQAAKAWGYKGDYYKAPSLSQLARDTAAQNRFGGAGELFRYMGRDVNSRLADNVQSTWSEKAEQYVSNIKAALTNSPEAAFKDSQVAKALIKIDRMTPTQIMKATSGEFFTFWYNGTDDNTQEQSGILGRILSYRGR